MLQRFIDAQKRDYATALAEIKNGRKDSHWIWYIFPQLYHYFPNASSYNLNYGIRGFAEAREYWQNEYLRGNLVEITTALSELKSNDIIGIMNSEIDALKLKSCMTLFSVVFEYENRQIEPEPENIFKKVLLKYFSGFECNWTMTALENDKSV